MAHTLKKKVWDLPTRLFHWSLALCVLAMAITGETGQMAWHFRIGYAVASLLLFRLVWGFVGGHWSRFGSFLYSPLAAWRQARGEWPEEQATGHSPLGALSVFAMLALLLAQVGTGLVSDDEIASTGPLAKFVSESTVGLATHYHKAYGKYMVLALVLLHVTAVVYYLARKQRNLVRPMVDGHKDLPQHVPASRDGWPQRGLAAAVFAACAGAVALMVKLSA